MHIDFHYNIFCLPPNFDYHFGWEKYNKKKNISRAAFVVVLSCFLLFASYRNTFIMQTNGAHSGNKARGKDNTQNQRRRRSQTATR